MSTLLVVCFHFPRPVNLTRHLRLGSGTGKFTRCLLDHKELGPATANLHAVEPSEGMRETFDKKIVDERVSCREGTFDHTSEEDGWADLVVSAQVSDGTYITAGTHSLTTKRIGIPLVPGLRQGTGKHAC